MSVELIDLSEVERMTKMSRATVYRLTKAGASRARSNLDRRRVLFAPKWTLG